MTPEQKDLQMRVQLFDKEFQALQNKYRLRAVAQLHIPGPGGVPTGAILTVPIQVYPYSQQPVAAPKPAAQADQASDPNE